LLISLLAIRIVSSALTLGSGGVGGLFFPLVLFGALTGSLFALIVHGSPSLWASVGISASISAGYKTPLCAVTFIGDTTGSVSYLVLGMIGSAISYVVSGQNSVSSEQILVEQLHPSELSDVKASDVMKERTSQVLSSDANVSDAIKECFAMRMNQAIFLDAQGKPRVVSLQDAIKIPSDLRQSTPLTNLPSEDALQVFESDSLNSVMSSMFEHKASIAAVSSRDDVGKIVGAVSREGIFEYIEILRSAKTEGEEPS
jgi:chloride channel protein, CIC family